MFDNVFNIIQVGSHKTFFYVNFLKTIISIGWQYVNLLAKRLKDIHILRKRRFTWNNGIFWQFWYVLILYVSRETISCPHLFHVEQKPLFWAGFRLFFLGFWAIFNSFYRFVSWISVLSPCKFSGALLWITFAFFWTRYISRFFGNNCNKLYLEKAVIIMKCTSCNKSFSPEKMYVCKSCGACFCEDCVKNNQNSCLKCGTTLDRLN